MLNINLEIHLILLLGREIKKVKKVKRKLLKSDLIYRFIFIINSMQLMSFSYFYYI